MIEINLSPPELRKKKKNKILGGFQIPTEMVVGIGGGVIALLIFVDILLLFTNIMKVHQHRGLKAQWEEILPSKTNVDAVINEMRTLQNTQKAVFDITGEKQFVWSQKLNILSDSLPRGVWLNQVSLGEEMLIVEGSAISRQSDEMINVHNFASNLNKDEHFLDSLYDVELGSIQRRNIQKTEVADFIIKARVE